MAKKASPLGRTRQVLAPEKRRLAAALAALVVASGGNFALPNFVAYIIDRSSKTSSSLKDTDRNTLSRSDLGTCAIPVSYHSCLCACEAHTKVLLVLV